MKKAKIVLVILLGFSAGAFLDSVNVTERAAEIEVLESDTDDNVLYDINTDDEWTEQAGILWTPQDSELDNGRFQIRNYGVWRMYDHRSAASYRTSEINASGESLKLGTLKATGYVAEGVDSGIRIKIYDCTKPQRRGYAERLVETCYGDNIVYDSGLIDTPGRAELDEDLSNITIDGYMNVGMEIVANTTESPDDHSYWDSLRLTREGSESNWGLNY